MSFFRMKLPGKFPSLFCLLIFSLWVTNAMAAPGRHAELPNFDQRLAPASLVANPTNDFSLALANLKSSLPDARVDFDEILGSPAWIISTRGFLSGTNGVGRTVSPAAAVSFPATDPYRPVKSFLQQYQGLFGHGPEVMAAATVVREFTNSGNGLHTVVWSQRLDDIEIFDARLIAHITRNGELVSLSSRFIPAPERAGDVGVTGRAALELQPPIRGAEAVAAAAQNLGENLEPADVTALDSPIGVEQRQKFTAAPLNRTAEARLVWLPMNRELLRLCWEVLLTSHARGESFRVLIDAQDGTARVRHCLTENISDATYRVYTAQSPTPQQTGFSSPVTNQPPEVARMLITTNALDTNASPNGWIDDGNNETRGNNVDAYVDRDGNDQPDGPRPGGSPFRVFDFPLDLTQDPVTYTNASVVNLFYWSNWMHDRLYGLGFTEAAGNFQVNNFGRGGLGNDPVEAEAQQGGDYNNSSFSAFPDGSPGILRLNLFNGPTPNRDADLDTLVILHEYTHGLSNRRVGGGVGITQLQSRGLGEGWSDFMSLALMSQPGDDVNACYPEGPYVSYLLYGLTQNYYFGIRRYPYSTTLTNNPETFKDIDPGQASGHSGIPRNPVISGAAAEVHNQGEIWCVTLWDARANLINKYGFATGNQLIMQLVCDGMNLTPANPTFIQARDAIIQADMVDNGGANYHQLWLAFAKRGLGYFASAPPNTTTSGVVESFSLPDDLLLTPAVDFTSRGTVGGPFVPSGETYTLDNTGTNLMNWAVGASVPWVSFSATNGALASGGGVTNVLVSLNAAANTLPVGSYTGLISFTNLSSGVSQTRNLALTVTAPHIYYFSLDTDPGWTRQGQWTFGQPAGLGGTSHGFPDPSAGATGTNVFGVNLQGDYDTTSGGPYYLVAGPLNFSGVTNVMLQFERWLNSDYSPYVICTVDASNDATNWMNAFTNNAGDIADNSWNVFQYNLSPVADNQSSVYVRWGYQVGSSAFAYSGWNIDDIAFLGIGQLSISLPTTATEGDGTLSGRGHIAVTHAPLVDLVVNLVSSNPSKVTVPATVTIPAGQTNGDFDITIIDNTLLDGTVVVTVSASAPGYSGCAGNITVFDNESAALYVTLPLSATEGDGQIQCAVTSSAAPVNPIPVSLSCSDTNSLQLPASAVIPAGQTSAVFFATVVQDGQLRGTRSVTVTAHVRNWTNGVSAITIYDNKSTDVLLALPSSARESNGTLTNAGYVQIGGTLTSNLVVTLLNGNPAKLSLPPNITIWSGQTSAVFNITMVAGNLPHQPVSVGVNATAPGLGGGSAAILIIDNQTPPVPIYLAPPNLSTTNPALLQLSWTAGLGEGVEEIINGGFESGDFTGWNQPGATNGAFIIDDGTFSPPSGDAPTPPWAGKFSAAATAPPPAISVLYQDFVLPTNCTTIILSWVDRIRNAGGAFATNQQFQVQLQDTNSLTLTNIYTSQPGDTLLADWIQRSADISAFAGQSVRVAFIVNAGQSYLDVHLDAVSVRCANVPPVIYAVYCGTNAVLSQSDYLGSTTNTTWSLPELGAGPYYWQIVAERQNQTAGPVWEFSSVPTLIVANATLFEALSANTNLVFNVSLSAPSAQMVSVDFATADNTAFAPGDYSPTNGTLFFSPGVTNQAIVVGITWSANPPASRAFFVNFSNPQNAPLVVTQAVGTLVNQLGSLPALLPIPNQTNHAGTVVATTVVVSNFSSPGDTFTFSLDPGAPTGALINPGTGQFAWPTTDANVGTNMITVRVVDNNATNFTATRTFAAIIRPRPTINFVSSSGGLITLDWTAIPGKSYRVQSSATLAGPWNAVPGDVTATNSIASKTDSVVFGLNRYYRILVLP
jgi:hypothetical protein